jgi:hypothetical protein
MRWLIVLAGCGSAAPATKLANETTRPSKVACPARGDELDRAARAAWGLAANALLHVPHCAEIQRGSDWLWYFAGEADHALDTDEQYGWPTMHALVRPPGEVLWKLRIPPQPYSYVFEASSTADLDGDGQDELLLRATYGEGGGAMKSMDVIDIAKLPPSLQTISPGDAGQRSCDGEWSLIKSGREHYVEIKLSGNDCASSRHVYRYANRQIVEIK